MNAFLRILIGLAVTGGGAYLVIRTRGVYDFFGPIDWAEAKLGGGGSYLLYKIIGIVLCFIGIIVTTNLWDWFLQATLGSLLPRTGADLP
jgi:hypothetical protein